MRQQVTHLGGSAFDFLPAFGEMSALVLAKDWSGTPLGPIDAWPPSLRAAVGVCLASGTPAFLTWGP